uniref:integrase core domain-containing protein n=1 Tax=Escherichia coli TaxID=562 RepID=UPI001D0C2F82
SCVVRRLRFSGPKTSIICSPMTSLKTSIKTITYLSDTGCLEIQGGSLAAKNLAEAFEHYNEWHPHSALGYRSPREYLRTLLVQGARSVLIGAEKRTDSFSRWVCTLVERRGYWRAVVAIAAKNARLCWASLHYGDDFRLYSAS